MEQLSTGFAGKVYKTHLSDEARLSLDRASSSRIFTYR